MPVGSESGITGLEDLERLIRRVRDLPEFVDQAAPKAARATHEQLNLTIRAGQNAYGNAWAPLKSGPGRPLERADRAVRVGAVRTRIIIRVTGIEARHHTGWVKGGTQRDIIPLPQFPLPEPIRDAITKVITETFTAYWER